MDIKRAGSQPSGRGPEASMSHVAVQEKLNGSPVQWLDKVSDAQYQG